MLTCGVNDKAEPISCLHCLAEHERRTRPLLAELFTVTRHRLSAIQIILRIIALSYKSYCASLLCHISLSARTCAASMAPPPTNGHRPVTLIEAARKCQTHLETLRQYAQKSKAEHHTFATKTLLDEVIRHTNGSIGSLKTWTTEIEKGRQTSVESIINTVNAYFEQLEEDITAAEVALEQRCHLRWLRFRGRNLIKRFVRGSKHRYDPLANLRQGKKQMSGSCKL